MLYVLVADDEPIERMVVTKKIQKYFGGRLETVVAENGEEAVQRFREYGCRIALLDISMPGMDGLEAAEKIREMDRNCSIIFLTAFDEFSYAKKAFGVRALDYLLKPGSDEELVAVLEEAIHLWQEEQENAAGIKAKQNLNETIHETEESPDGSGESDENVRFRAVADHIRHYIEQHYKEDISLQDVAGHMGYSDAYFCKIFKHCFDKNFTVYLTEFRVEKAKLLLADVTINIKNVCVQVGVRDSNYFTKVFKRNTGKAPSEYRKYVLKQSLPERAEL